MSSLMQATSPDIKLPPKEVSRFVTQMGEIPPDLLACGTDMQCVSSPGPRYTNRIWWRSLQIVNTNGLRSSHFVSAIERLNLKIGGNSIDPSGLPRRQRVDSLSPFSARNFRSEDVCCTTYIGSCVDEALGICLS